MILAFVLKHLLDVEAAGQVALSEVVAQLGYAQQPRVHTHALSVWHTHTSQTQVMAYVYQDKA